jgi:hypothetical protein
VQAPLGSPIAGAVVSVKKGVLTVGGGSSLSNGTFSIGNLKPGTYTLVVTRSGYTFTVPAATIVVGPSSSGNIVTALTGTGFAPRQPLLEKKKQGAGRRQGGVVSEPAR